MFFQQFEDGTKTILIVYVNNIVLTEENLVEIESLKKGWAIEFKVKDLGQMHYFLIMEVSRSKKVFRNESTFLIF